ncbi:MAG: hypothetical protein SWZ49_21555 [Cyanobacteriota bacterium]|nr:hypothetical protein [Cyanobacteriota bacterium]
MSVNIVSQNSFKNIKLSIIIAITSVSMISIHKPAVAESMQLSDSNSNILQRQIQCEKKDNDGSKRGRPKTRKPMGSRLYSVNC